MIDGIRDKRREWVALKQDNYIKGQFYSRAFGVLAFLLLVAIFVILV